MPKTYWHSALSTTLVCNWVFVTLLVFLYLLQPALSQELLNVSVPVTSSQITYTPFVCNATTVLANPQACAGAWQLSDPSNPGVQTISAFGPSSASANIIPQMFFTFRALPYNTSSSNATMNVTVSANGTAVSAIFNSSLESIRAVNLPGSEATFLSITFLPSSTPTRFDLQSVTITVAANATITSFLPQETLPPSISVPSFTLSSRTTTSAPTISTAVPQARSNRKMIAEAVGLTWGWGWANCTSGPCFICWRRRRHREMNVSMQETQSGWRWETPRAL
ncbi:hypothetical protein CPB84DRAFT_1743849 [Gymnopilus junonius]|uniref:Uncharacterized protein n=1 Tax=Gymnopilus junonius TaxID=109634 RepID=A0A9P5NWW3_GYMJU|nr:hypothetical protein CPB84DRAFT_1743849 [Gymnopilus junonius]